MHFTPLITERLIIRTAGPGDARAITRYHLENREHLTPWEPARPEHFYTESFWAGQIERDAEEREAGRALRLFFFDRLTPVQIRGTAHFSQIVRGVFHACSLGYSIGRESEGQGYMREGLSASIEYVFGELRLHRIQANYIPTNVRSGNLLRRLGFVVEGYARDYLLIAGRWQDHVLTSLTNPDWSAEDQEG
jgi:[ribosomal protein S5]-alanine N-acetyltransferase